MKLRKFLQLFFVLLLVVMPSFQLKAKSEVTLEGKEFVLNGDASYDASSGIVTLTPQTATRSGNITLKERISFNTDFSMELEVNLGNKGSNGADGMGIIFHAGDQEDSGINGQGLGIVGLKNAHGIALDTYRNEGDAPTPSVAIWETDGKGLKKPIKNNVYMGPSIVDGNFHKVVVDYNKDTSIMSVSFENKVWETFIDKTIYGEKGGAFSITASTGALTNLHQVKIKKTDFIFTTEGKVNVHYTDQQGNKLAESSELVDIIGQSYHTTPKEISGYQLMSLPANAEGVYTQEDTDVAYVYSPLPQYNVTYNGNGHSGGEVPIDENLYLSSHSITLLPGAPQKTGHTFLGWNYNGALYQAGDILTMGNQNIVLTAEWLINQYTVVFVTDSEASVPTQTVDFLQTFAEPHTMEKDGYTFGGWYLDPDFTEEYDFYTPVISDITLYAKWDVKIYHVTFIAQPQEDDTPIQPVAVAYDIPLEDVVAVPDGNLLEAPVNPTQDAMIFEGWHTEPECRTMYDFNQPVKSDFILYGKWSTVTEAEQEQKLPSTGENISYKIMMSLLILMLGSLVVGFAYNKKLQ